MSSSAEWAGIEELASVLNVRIGAWNHFGYVNPPTSTSASIPPLGERSADAIRARHGAVEMIDQIIRELHAVREVLIDEGRANEDALMARPL